MLQDPGYETTLRTSLKAAWNLDDVFPPGTALDFSCNFLPESLARTAAAPGLDAGEQRLLNHISAHQYLALFVIVEEFILPFLLDHARHALRDDEFRLRSLLNFAGEEAKHIQLFKRFHQAFVRDFPVRCEVIGPSEAIGAEVLRHDPLAVALTVLMFEWMSQVHYLGSIRDDAALDPLFKKLMRFHWMEEAQHAKLDALIILAMAKEYDEERIDAVVDELFEIAAFLDDGLLLQAGLNLDALEQAIGRAIDGREELAAQQHQAARATYIGSGLTHDRFNEVVSAISPRAQTRIAAAARAFA